MHRGSMRPVSRRAATGLVACGVIILATGCAEQTERAYVERLGVDTMSIEMYERTDSGFDGTVLIRSPQTQVAHYRADLGADGTIARMEVEWSTPPENPEGAEPRGYVVTFEGDSATVERRGGPNPGTSRMAVPPGTIPLVGTAAVTFAVLEQAVRQAIASGSEDYPVNFLSPARGRIMPNAIVRLSPDSISISSHGSPLVARVSADGRILGRSGERTTYKAVGESVAPFNLTSLAADFAGRDARGEGIGVASPSATVETTIAGANLSVVYSQPAKRGRETWGGLLVPYNEVWRTGANAATAFSTDRDLEIGGADVPAGSYTLYSIYTPESAQLIINKQTGQWGTVYDEAQDLARVDLTGETLAQPVERFTISIEPRGDGGVLQLTWDRTRFSVPFTVK
jgi:endonuclease YncB( thermonuclease family)